LLLMIYLSLSMDGDKVRKLNYSKMMSKEGWHTHLEEQLEQWQLLQVPPV